MLLLFYHCALSVPNPFAESLEPQMSLDFGFATVNRKSIYISG